MSDERNILNEFSSVVLGDYRLEQRLKSIVESISVKPAESFPKNFPDSAKLEGFYRFIRNPSVHWEQLLKSHFKETTKRARTHKELLCIHDSSVLKFKRREDVSNLGTVGGNAKTRTIGFLCHFSLLVSADGGLTPVGLLDANPIRRQKRWEGVQRRYIKRKDEKEWESYKWKQGVTACRKKLGDQSSLVHVMDREADCYALMHDLIDSSERFVIRIGRENRCIQRGVEKKKIKDAFFTAPVSCEREIYLSKRNQSRGSKEKKRYPVRNSRKAQLVISATSIDLPRSPDTSKTDYKNEIRLNIIHVSEPHPPAGEKAVDWKLFTTEPVESEKDVLKVVDIYRARWTIEEFFKALKTGCSYEDRQVESFKTAMNVMALLLPMAWQMLLLRHYGREQETQEKIAILNPTQLAILISLSKGKINQQATPHQILYQIAALGGHIKNNGNPGWLVIYRGLSELYTLERGVNLGLSPPQHVINH